MQDVLIVGKETLVMFLSWWYMHCTGILQWIA